jgi:hypothetical protein
MHMVNSDRLNAEGLVALPARIETALANINVNPQINVAIPVITNINTGVQVAVLGSPIQQMIQGNLAGAGVGQANG